MFKISIIDTVAQRKLLVEGKPSEPWVAELRTTCRNASSDFHGRKLVIDVSSLTVILKFKFLGFPIEKMLRQPMVTHISWATQTPVLAISPSSINRLLVIGS